LQCFLKNGKIKEASDILKYIYNYNHRRESRLEKEEAHRKLDIIESMILIDDEVNDSDSIKSTSFKFRIKRLFNNYIINNCKEVTKTKT
jgi:hypothetical protein